MAVELRRGELVEDAAQQNSSGERRVETGVWDRLLAEVRVDARRDSEQYLDESTVPHGGE